MGQNKHKIPISGYNPKTKELFFSWSSSQSASDLPDRTIVYNLEYGHASYMDHGFTAMVNYQSYNQMSLGDFIIETIVDDHDVSICPCNDTLDDVMQGSPYVLGRTDSTTEFPSLWNSDEDVDDDAVAGWKELGVDTLALGIQSFQDKVLDLLGVENNPILAVAKEVEKQALADDYFVDRKLFPNVDFYSGIILEAMGFPTSMFTPIFAVSRTVGWVSQWKEMIEDPAMKIGRPRQLYTGPSQRDYVDVENR